LFKSSRKAKFWLSLTVLAGELKAAKVANRKSFRQKEDRLAPRAGLEPATLRLTEMISITYPIIRIAISCSTLRT
jgi:hypothetical protein